MYNRNYFTDFEFWSKQNIKSKKHFKTVMGYVRQEKRQRRHKEKVFSSYERARGNAETYERSYRSRLSSIKRYTQILGLFWYWCLLLK